MRSARLLPLAVLLAACTSSSQKGGTFAIGAGEKTFTATGDTDIERFVEEPPVPGGPAPGNLQLKPSVCEGIDLRPANDYLEADDLTRFLEQQGVAAETRSLRPDLVLVKIQAKNAKDLELRVAILDSSTDASGELHRAMLEHGQGSWGLHRSNLSVLGPIGSVEDIVDVAASTQLACWGSLLIEGRDDTFAIGGGYVEF